MDYRNDLIQRVLENSASFCPTEFQDFTIRGEQATVVTWNERMLSDKGLDIQRLRDLTVILENRAELIGLTSKVNKT